MSHSLGHFVESFPIAVSAFILNYSGIINKQIIWKNVIMIYCAIFNFLIYKYNIFTEITIYGKTYYYNGLDKNIFAFLSFIFFYLIPFEKVKSNYINKIIDLITKYTQGIYCVHLMMISYGNKYFHVGHTFKGSIIIYILSFLFSFIGEKLFFHTKLKYLFI